MLRRLLGAAGVAALLLTGSARTAAAQTDYYNTDLGRPLQIEDALALERHGFELQAAPLRVERRAGGRYSWGIEPELAWGILPRTQIEIGVPLAFQDNGPGTRGVFAGAGVDVSLLHALNVESLTLPAFAIGASALLPGGGLGPDRAYASVKGVATRTTRRGRLHVNALYTFGDDLVQPLPLCAGASAGCGAAAVAGPGALELSRWLVGAAADHAFALRSLLVGAELYARRSLEATATTEWTAGAGTRYQLSPRWLMDAGVGRRFTGDDQGWYLTVGTAYAFGLRGMIGGVR